MPPTPSQGIKVHVNEDNITDVQATITGPGKQQLRSRDGSPLLPALFGLCAQCWQRRRRLGVVRALTPANDTSLFAPTVGTPYEGGVFRMKLVMGPDFPAAPPKGFFVTKIFHPNVAPNGAICVNTLKKDWKPEHGLEHVLTVIKCLLIQPNPASALNEEAGKLLLEAYDDFSRHAKMMTEIHAKPSAADLAAMREAEDGDPAALKAAAPKKRAGDKKVGGKKPSKKSSLKRL